MNKVHKYYRLDDLTRVEVEFLSSQQLVDKGQTNDGRKYSTKDTIVFVRHVEMDRLGTNHSYDGYDHWITNMGLKELRKGYVRKTLLSTLAVRILKFVMRGGNE